MLRTTISLGRGHSSSPGWATAKSAAAWTRTNWWFLMILGAALLQNGAWAAPSTLDETPPPDINLVRRGTAISTLGYYTATVFFNCTATYRHINRLIDLVAVIGDSSNYAGAFLTPKEKEVYENQIKAQARRLWSVSTLGKSTDRFLANREPDVPMEDTFLDRAKRSWDALDAPLPGNEQDHTPQQHVLRRVKRSWFSILNPIVGGVFNIIRTVKMYQLQKDMDTVKQVQDDLLLVVDDLQTTVGNQGTRLVRLEEWSANMTAFTLGLVSHLEANDIIRSQIDLVTKQVDHVVTNMDLLLDHRISLTIFEPQQMNMLLAQIRKETEDAGYEILAKTEAEIFQSKATHAMVIDGFLAFISIPIAHKDDHMTLYEYVPVPVVLDDDHHLTFTPSHPVIAISDDKESFRTLTLAELNQCERIGELHLCPNANVVAKKDLTVIYDGQRNSDLCAWFLYDYQYQDAARACELRVHAPTDGAYHLSGPEYIFVVTKAQKVTIACPGEPDMFDQVLHIKRVTVGAGCTATSTHHVVTGMAELYSEEALISYKWPYSLADLRHGLNLTQLSIIEERNDPDVNIPEEKNALVLFLHEDSLHLQEEQRETAIEVFLHKQELDEANPSPPQPLSKEDLDFAAAEAAALVKTDLESIQEETASSRTTDWIQTAFISASFLTLGAFSFWAYTVRAALLVTVNFFIDRAIKEALKTAQNAAHRLYLDLTQKRPYQRVPTEDPGNQDLENTETRQRESTL
jgi:Baculovirus F protein